MYVLPTTSEARYIVCHSPQLVEIVRSVYVLPTTSEARYIVCYSPQLVEIVRIVYVLPTTSEARYIVCNSPQLVETLRVLCTCSTCVSNSSQLLELYNRIPVSHNWQTTSLSTIHHNWSSIQIPRTPGPVTRTA